MTRLDAESLPTVLCVDDDPAVLRALERVLRRFGCRVLLADNGAAGLEILAREQVEVLICDEAMPGMLGTEMLNRAKAVAPGTSRILMTGHCGDQAVMMRAINGGEIFRLLGKPWDNDQLCAAVADALGSEPAAWCAHRQRAAKRLEALNAATAKAGCRPLRSEPPPEPQLDLARQP